MHFLVNFVRIIAKSAHQTCTLAYVPPFTHRSSLNNPALYIPHETHACRHVIQLSYNWKRIVYEVYEYMWTKTYYGNHALKHNTLKLNHQDCALIKLEHMAVWLHDQAKVKEEIVMRHEAKMWSSVVTYVFCFYQKQFFNCPVIQVTNFPTKWR